MGSSICCSKPVGEAQECSEGQDMDMTCNLTVPVQCTDKDSDTSSLDEQFVNKTVDHAE